MRRFLLLVYRRFFSNPNFFGFNLFIYECGLRGIGVLNYEDMDVSGERYFLTKTLPKILCRKPKLCMDIGANIGNYTGMLMELYPDCQVYSFEPHPKSALLLKNRFKNAKIEVLELAVSESDGDAVLYDKNEDGTQLASLYRGAIESVRGDLFSSGVKKISIDSFIKIKEINEIDFMKIDVEGAEIDVIKGSAIALAEKKICCIQFEFNEMNVINKVFLRDIIALLRGYIIYRLLPKGMIPVFEWPLFSEIFGYQNIVAIRRDFLSDKSSGLP